MRKALILSTLVISLAGSPAAHAQDHDSMHHHQHMGAMTADLRQPVNFPPEMHDHILANMRGHLEALSDIMTAMSTGAYAEAAQIAKTRLGMESPAAEGCKAPDAKDTTPRASQPMDMDRMMAQLMPERMRNFGIAMHQSASDFAAEAAKADKTADAKPAFTALARITRQCTACHAAYKLQ